MLWLAVPFLTGILLARDGFALPALVVASAASLIAPIPLGKRVALLAALVIGIVDVLCRQHYPEPNDAHMRTLHATILESRALDESAQAIVARLDDGERVRFSLNVHDVPVGERLTLRAEREAFDAARNPGETAERDLEAERGITWRLVHARVIARAPPDCGDLTLWLPRLRAWGSIRVHALLGEPDATILAGAMWGERGTLPPQLRSEFQDTGTVHILVTAGLHLGVVAALAFGLLSLLGCGRIASSLGTIPLVWMYAELSGAHLPSIRAATMLTFALVARASGRTAFSWDALALAAIVVTGFDPQAITSLSFVLSFSCVAAIFAFTAPLAATLIRFGAGATIAQLFAVAFAAQIGTWPLTAFGFLVIAPYAPLANAAIVPIVGIAMIVGFAALLATPVPWIAHAIANIAIALVDWIASVVGFVAEFPAAHVIATPPPGWAIASYYVAIAGMAVSLAHQRFRRAAAIVVTCSIALCLWPPHAGRTASLTVTAIDVGQADSLLVQTPAGHAFLIDAGGRLESGSPQHASSSAEEIGERIVVPFLIRRGIHHLDAILVSHPHGDHAGGIAPVLRSLGANGFADSGQTYPGRAYHDALNVARINGVPMLEPRAGSVWRTDDDVTFRFYGPSTPFITGSRSDINSNSLVFRLEYRRFAMLFMGDAGTETEERLLSASYDLRADILKVGHHGSAYGTTPLFVRAVAPRVAIISVGRRNLFGHPAPRTITTLQSVGARVFRTDQNGAITVVTDGSLFEILPFLVP